LANREEKRGRGGEMKRRGKKGGKRGREGERRENKRKTLKYTYYVYILTCTILTCRRVCILTYYML